MGDILVIGSSNTDMVISVAEIPVPGQTVLGDSFRVFGGGKGANQAIAARRAGARVRFLVSVGNDPFGRTALETFRKEGIDTGLAQVQDGVPSGVALIFVDASGENCIGVAPGANAQLSAETVERQAAAFSAASHVLLQLEVPLPAVARAIELAGENGARVVLNPAPAAALPGESLRGVYCITPNESEAEQLTGLRVTDLESVERAADALLERGVQNVIVTLGRQGAYLKGAAGVAHEAAPAVEVVDSTAAGDAFNGILVALLAEGRELADAMRIAVRGATLAVTRRGAADSIPHRHEYE